ncbi:hypothetical protein PHYC_03569 [Phycisphaerales bacterium]|nr:hypothetical protein PHYC_03569 [Phycisphaerales bacterium]
MRKSVVIAALAGLGLAAAAQAGVAMSFADPIPGRQMHNQANGSGPGIGFLTYDMAAPIQFLFDGSEDGLPNHVFLNARMEMQMSIGAATTVGGITTAPVSGFFKILDASSETPTEIITGIADAGTFVRISNTNSILFSDPNFSYTPGAALLAVTGPISFIDPSEAVFTLTSVVAEGGGSFINPDGTFRTFDANASFTGNTESVPTPGALALSGLGALCLARRRRA